MNTGLDLCLVGELKNGKCVVKVCSRIVYLK